MNLNRFSTPATLCLLLTTAGIIARPESTFAIQPELGRFAVGPFQTSIQDWPVEVNLFPSQLALASGLDPAIDEERLELVEILPEGLFSAPLLIQVSRLVAPWQGPGDERVLIWSVPGETPAGSTRRFSLRVRSQPAVWSAAVPRGLEISRGGQETTVSNRFSTLTHDHQKGFGISRVLFRHTGTTLEVFMGDEMYTPESNGRKEAARMWYADPKLEIAVLEQGPLRSILEARVHFQGVSQNPPEAVYRYTYWADRPVVGLHIWLPKQKLDVKEFESSSQARFCFQSPHAFPALVAGDPIIRKSFGEQAIGVALCDRNVSRSWACLTNGREAFGLIGNNLGYIHGTSGGQLIAGPGRAPWWRGPWRGQEERWHSWVYAGPPGPGEATFCAQAALLSGLQPALRIPALDARHASLMAGLAGPTIETRSPGRRDVLRQTISALAALGMDAVQAGEPFRADSLLRQAEQMSLARTRAMPPSDRMPLLVSSDNACILANDRMGL